MGKILCGIYGVVHLLHFFGKYAMKTFERYFIDDKETHKDLKIHIMILEKKRNSIRNF